MSSVYIIASWYIIMNPIIFCMKRRSCFKKQINFKLQENVLRNLRRSKKDLCEKLPHFHFLVSTFPAVSMLASAFYSVL